MARAQNSRVFAVLFVLGIGGLISTALYIRATGIRPRIEIVPERVDLGILAPDGKIDGTISIANTGSGPLDLTDLKSSCGCTLIHSYRRTVLPGEKTKIDFSYSANRRRGSGSSRIYITSNDPERPRIPVDIVAQIRGGFEWFPSTIEVGSILRGQTKRLSVSLLGPLESGEHAPRVEPSSYFDIENMVAFEEGPVDSPSRRWIIDAAFHGAGSPGRIQSQISIAMSSHDRHIVLIPFNMEVVGDYIAIPDSLFFGVVEEGGVYHASVNLRPSGAQSSPTSLSAFGPPYLDLSFENSGTTGTRLNATLKVDRFTPEASADDSVTLGSPDGSLLIPAIRVVFLRRASLIR